MSNEDERGFMFDGENTHVGISCGCHADLDDMCCYAYGKNVVDKPDVTTPSIAYVN